jgi:patatin-like phospholipase/acyl hydrolase
MSWLVKGPRYDQKRLKAVLEETFRENGKQLQLGDCRPAIVVAATMLDRYGIRTFSTFEHFGRDGELFASDVALASAAAPLFFPAIRPRGRTKIGEVQTEQRTYVDGGVWANNPVLLAVIEAHRQRQVSFSDMRVISIGNGEVPSGAVGVDFNQMRRAKMLNPVLDMMFSTQSELADQVAALLLGDATMTGQRLLRVNAQLEKAIELDDVQEAIQKLKPLAEHEARKGFGEFKRILN